MWITSFGYINKYNDLCIVRSGSVERAGASCQLKKSEVGCCHPTYYSRERNTKVRPFLVTTKSFYLIYNLFKYNPLIIYFLVNFFQDFLDHSARRLPRETRSPGRAASRSLRAPLRCSDRAGHGCRLRWPRRGSRSSSRAWSRSPPRRSALPSSLPPR